MVDQAICVGVNLELAKAIGFSLPSFDHWIKQHPTADKLASIKIPCGILTHSQTPKSVRQGRRLHLQ